MGINPHLNHKCIIMKVYIVQVESIYDMDAFNTDYPKVFDSLEKAKAELSALAKRETEESPGWEVSEDNSDTSFEIWKDGDYTAYHTKAEIITAEVQ